MKEVRNAKKQEKLATDAAMQDRIAAQKAQSEAKKRNKVDKAAAKALKALETVEKEEEKRFSEFQASLLLFPARHPILRQSVRTLERQIELPNYRSTDSCNNQISVILCLQHTKQNIPREPMLPGPYQQQPCLRAFGNSGKKKYTHKSNAFIQAKAKAKEEALQTKHKQQAEAQAKKNGEAKTRHETYKCRMQRKVCHLSHPATEI